MAVAVTNTNLVKFGTEVAVTSNAATSTVADATEVFTITPTVKGSKVLIIIGEGAGDSAVGWSFAAGAQWGSTAVDTGSVAAGTEEAIVLDSAKHLSAAGTYLLTLTPASGKKLLTDEAAYVKVIQLPF